MYKLMYLKLEGNVKDNKDKTSVHLIKTLVFLEIIILVLLVIPILVLPVIQTIKSRQLEKK